MKQQRQGKDLVFPSSNLYGIPDLDKDYQAKAVDLPWTAFRSRATSRSQGTVHFYKVTN